MARFKVGDRVKIKKSCTRCVAGEICTLAMGAWNGDCADELFARSDSPNKGNCSCESNWELITTSPVYTKIEPKVGERYRVLKTMQGDKHLPYTTKGTILEIIEDDETENRRIKATNGKTKTWLWNDQLTTEYLELVEGVRGYKPDVLVYDEVIDSWKVSTNACIGVDTAGEPTFIKKVTNKTMKALKKLTQSKEDRTLEKTGYIDECGELTAKTTDILLALLFKEKKTDLVKMAEEELKEDKE